MKTDEQKAEIVANDTASPPAKDIAKYMKGRWHGKPLYQSPYHREFATVNPAEFRKHLRGMPAQKKKPKAQASTPKSPSGKKKEA